MESIWINGKKQKVIDKKPLKGKTLLTSEYILILVDNGFVYKSKDNIKWELTNNIEDKKYFNDEIKLYKTKG